jgi:predicted nucleic acid-binding protein
MTDPVFVDTNVLVYARDASEPEKQPAASLWLERLWRNRSGRVSAQVLSEYYVTVTHKLDPGMPTEAARRDVRNFMAWDPLPIGPTLIEHAWSLQDRFSLPYWDALIVAAAQIVDCDLLLSEDLQDGQRLDGVTIVCPFRHAPDAVLGP